MTAAHAEDEQPRVAVGQANARLGLFLGVVSAVALFAAIMSSVQSTIYSHCQARVNEQLVLALREHESANVEDQKADRAESLATAVLIRAAFTAKGRDQVLGAYRTYDAELARIGEQRKAAQRQRTEHPLPALPSDTCR